MDVTAITTLITTVGFPVVVCMAMMYYVKYLNDQHKQEIDKLSEALQNNTLVMQRLLTKLGGDEDGV